MEAGKNYIVILQRGWVWIGTLYPHKSNGLLWHLRNSGNIRIWGTKGIGLEGLADKGPQPKTVIDRGTTEKTFPIISLIGTIEINMEAEGWKKWFHSQ